MEFLKKYKGWIIGITVTVVVIIIAYFTYRAIKKSGTAEALATIPNPANDEPLTNDERLSIATINNALKHMLSGIGWQVFWSDYQPITDLSLASTRVQIGVYQQYKVDTNDDLITDILALKSANYDFNLLRDNLIPKLKSQVQ